MQTRIHDFLTEAAAVAGESVAVVDHKDQRHTWGEVLQAADEAEVVLRAFGVRAGDRVVLVFENCIAVPAFINAVSRLDAISVVINARLTETELSRIFGHSDPSLVMFSTDVSSVAQSHADHFEAKTVSGAFGSVALLRREGSAPEPVFEAADEQVALMLYTSGTTGAPKAPMLTHGNLINATKATAAVRDVQSDDVCFLALPLSHIYGFVTFLAMTWAKGTIRMEARFAVERMYQAMQEDVTFLPGVPQMHAQLFHYARANNKARYDRGLLRHVSSGGAPLDPVWKREAEAFYGLPLQNGYGLTEGTAGVCATQNAKGDPDISVGRPMLNCKFRLDMDVPGADAEKGIGEIQLGGPQVMKGYFRDPEQTAQALTEDGFFRTGDLGRIDDEGRMHISGRCKELIIHSGFNVYPNEVEATLSEHPDVVFAGVVGRAIQGNEEVLAFVKVDAGCAIGEADLKDFVHDKLAPYKRPARIIVATDLPAAPTGKILKSKLIEAFADQL
ncbi:long-chain fatty acid--CoA ligase [Ruegeria sp. ANG-S4]|uniref:class I adenylate-forming enzyme family protein n=1 Tax=Ruegeria sp. ANG-S4 TaxID=1577904 RepID=UPI00057FDE22|nr:class I adenylate-forming enzyme family protein [Ruegeria sp. ANG-S4]KIC45874.1 long-chain fatty acid--CoA ligase [Ruegeria sp. ANG-S4]